MVLVGPSGCGKTTALRMLAGLEEITSGEIQIGDRIVNDVPPKDRDIAMVFQSYALYPHMSVYDNLAFGLKLRKTPKREIDQRVRQAAETLGISNLLTRKPKQLAPPQEVYDHPSNVFVAGFIGSPAMNFIEAQLVSDGGQLYVDTGFAKLSVPESKAPAVRSYQGKEVLAGIRPEDIYDRALV